MAEIACLDLSSQADPSQATERLGLSGSTLRRPSSAPSACARRVSNARRFIWPRAERARGGDVEPGRRRKHDDWKQHDHETDVAGIAQFAERRFALGGGIVAGPIGGLGLVRMDLGVQTAKLSRKRFGVGVSMSGSSIGPVFGTIASKRWPSTHRPVARPVDVAEFHSMALCAGRLTRPKRTLWRGASVSSSIRATR